MTILPFLLLAFIGLVFGSNTTEKTITPSTVAPTNVSSVSGQIPLVFHHRTSSQKRHRRQYQSEKSPPYEIRFLPYPAPPPLRQARGSAHDTLYGPNSIETSPSTTTLITSTEVPLTYPAPTLITTIPSYTYSTMPSYTYSTLPPYSYTASTQSTSTSTKQSTPISFNTNHQNAYMQPPNGLPRDSSKGDHSGTGYYYPPRMPLPLSQCFFNPTGYACCNAQLNDLMVETYSELEAKPKFHVCNINAIASMLQSKAEKRFNTTFETIAGFEDFAQKVHFNGDLICKIELGGKFMLAYGTAKGAGENGSGGYSKYSGDTLKRQRREVIYGPENEVPENDLSKEYSMWI